MKWDLARKQQEEKKFVICNGDEGDPGAFMDRCIMEGNPHRVIEGMVIAARAIEADEGYVYVRAEYPLAVKHIRKAIEDAYRLGILGRRLLGSKQTFDVHVMEGAGAFVCGEKQPLSLLLKAEEECPHLSLHFRFIAVFGESQRR